MTALLIDNLPLLAGAPNGIKKLRELILELAVRGKLVPQDPSDEPASELLKRIAEEKARLVAEGKIKKQKPLAEVGEEAETFELPAGWKWSSLAQVAFVNPRNAAADSLEVSFVPMTFIGTRFDDQHGQEPRLWGEVKQGFTHFAEGDIGVAKITPCFENSKACVFSNLMNGLGAGTTELHIVRPANGTLDPRYVLAYLKSPQFLLVGETKMTGTAGQKRLPKDFVEANPFPLPPLAEQHRIVAKVDELMALCDRLDTQQADAGSAHAQLVKALLDSLTQASDATDFATNWQRLAEHFHTLFTTEPSIDALKQTLLQLAVMGKLVPQVSSDEPADELLAHLAKDRSDYAAVHKIAVTKPEPISEYDQRVSLPAGWAWTRLCSMFRVITDGDHQSPPKSTDGIAFLTIGNVTKGHLDFSNCRFVPQDYFNQIALYRRPEIGDILYTVVGATYGRPIAVDSPRDFCVQRHIAILKGSELLNSAFACYLLSSPWVYEQATQSTTGTAQPTIPLRPLRNFLVMLPPLAEQHRIVAKVDQLMALCNQLKTRLTQARQLNEQLACTLVERALSEDGQRATIPTDRQVARTLLAAEITHRLHSQRTFGQRKLQKVIYLAEHVARIAAIQGDYLRDAAGPHDRQLMNKVEGELQNNQWYERIERETVGHAYRPLSQAGQHRQAYSSAWSAAERITIEQVIELMRDWDTDRCEMTVTLYAAWNDFILEGRPVTDKDIVNEVMHSWNDTKLRFGKTEWLAILAEMKKHKILMPTGFGKRTKGGMLSLPGFE
ncbi:restriction endonuclease subunit S [Pseudomonas sp. R45(2017)]|uniref:restriction endonuclease subunit S n=1 Tax=Pseudomonas sp. R45(2017) TaxID=1981678 RepID=UPI000A1E5892|nr:restriction endonuclease subunit S [Pseudomonas sp. R45(2017)]